MSDGKCMLAVGVDEAGRGPLIGDMFLTAVGVCLDNLKVLQEEGIKDSKKLSPAGRKRLFPKIVELSEVIIVRRYTPEDIDTSNINNLFAKGVTDLLRSIRSLGFHVAELYIDAVNSPKIKTRVLGELEWIGNIRYEVKADEKFPIVGAASIVAKFLRDQHVSALQDMYGDFGSGYPSDPRTVKWIEEWIAKEGEPPPIVRRTWKTLRRYGYHKEKKTFRTLTDYLKKKK